MTPSLRVSGGYAKLFLSAQGVLEEEGSEMKIIYRQMDIMCDHCGRSDAGDIVDSVGGWAHVKCPSCGWVSSCPER
jgi:DNA-directed RNA polymerase subunit RPC12/RpoP